METVKLMTCDNSQKAAIIKGRLESEGIHCFLTNENFSTLMPSFNGRFESGIQVMINKEDHQKARQILNLEQ
jgi:hypothetical protein